MTGFTLFASSLALAALAGVVAGPCRPLSSAVATTATVQPTTTAVSISSVTEAATSTGITTEVEITTTITESETQTTTTVAEAQSTTTAVEVESTTATTGAETGTTTTAAETTTTTAEVQSTTTATAPAEPTTCGSMPNPYTAPNGRRIITTCGEKVIGDVKSSDDLTGVTFKRCLDACSEDSNCYASSYRRADGTCELWQQVDAFANDPEWDDGYHSGN